MTVSIGIAVMDGGRSSTLEALIESADRALYEAKEKGPGARPTLQSPDALRGLNNILVRKYSC